MTRIRVVGVRAVETFAFVAICAGLLVTERSLARATLVIAALSFSVAALAMPLGDLARPVWLSGLVACAIVAISKIKLHHSGRKLIVADLALLGAGTFRFMIHQYRFVAFALLVGGVCVIIGALLVFSYGAGRPLEIEPRIVLLVAATAALLFALGSDGEQVASNRDLMQPDRWLSTFIASFRGLLEQRIHRGLTMRDLAAEPMALLPARAGRSAIHPDILLIQHESVFDPRRFGLSIGAGTEHFFTPPHGLGGTLEVEIYGGGSWQSEFSAMTGLSSAGFGGDAYRLLDKGVGRFKHHLPSQLVALGYGTTLISSCARGFMNYDAFYAALTMQERIFSDDFADRPGMGDFTESFSDEALSGVVADIHRQRAASGSPPWFAYVLTNFNHGPHDRAPGAAQNHADGNAAAGDLSDREYGEYARRLTITADCWRRMRAELEASARGRASLIVHYGDHQPVLTRRIERSLALPPSPERAFETFYAIEAINCELDATLLACGERLHITELGNMTLRLAGLPLDAISATRASLIDAARAARRSGGTLDDGAATIAGFHRTLVDLGAIDLAPKSPLVP